MRLEGFTSFREPSQVDFDDADYFALVGPTGSGKSSLIDALAFALYGCVARYDDRRLVAPVISQGRVEARVGLDFMAGGCTYRVVRVVRATGKGKGATTKEARLERLASAAADAVSLEVLAGDADAVTAEVTRLLGLRFDHFTKCVVLPQGDFARFLHDKPAARQDLLVELLGLGVYAEVGQRAAQEASAAASTAAAAQQRLDQPPLSEATAAAEAQAQARVAELDALRAQIAVKEPALHELTERQRQAEEQCRAASARVALLQALDVPDGAAALATDVERAEAAVASAEQDLSAARASLGSAEAAVATLPPRGVLEAVLAAHDERDEVLARIEKGERLTVDLRDAEAEAERALEASQKKLAAARSAKETAFEAGRAAALARCLVAGQPCPVCQQTVHRPPPALRVPDLEAATDAVDAAEREVEEATHAWREASRQTASADQLLASLRDRLTAIESRTVEHPDRTALTGVVRAALEAEKSLASARADERRACAAANAAEEARARLTSDLQSAWAQFDATRDSVAALGPPPVLRDDLMLAWGTLLDWARQRRPIEQAVAHEAASRALQAACQAEEVATDVTARCRAAGVDTTGTTPAEALAHARARAQAELETVRVAHEEVQRLREVARLASQESQTAKALAQHLRASGFEKWLLDEVLDGLVRGATEVLRELSSAAYSLTLDGNGGFAVVDHRNADAVRSARTLSGGETFLASLALALALADRLTEFAAEGSAPLEAIFLDEGFGSLDPDTLETVAAAIENLAAGGRVVGVVTHVRELADRVPVRFEVERDLATSRVRRVDG